jgi:hypothetical protein
MTFKLNLKAKIILHVFSALSLLAAANVSSAGEPPSAAGAERSPIKTCIEVESLRREEKAGSRMLRRKETSRIHSSRKPLSIQICVREH